MGQGDKNDGEDPGMMAQMAFSPEAELRFIGLIRKPRKKSSQSGSSCRIEFEPLISFSTGLLVF
jgi:hypothetical protein